MMKIPSNPRGSNDDILKLARERFTQGTADFAFLQRQRELDDRHFAAGNQWDVRIYEQRIAERRPALTFNRIQSSVRTVRNAAQQSRPQISVTPVDSASDPDAANVIKGLFKHIEAQSDSESVYDTAITNAAVSGRGWIRVITKTDPYLLEDDILLERVRNPLSVVWDPTTRHLNGSDAHFAFVFENVSKQWFCDTYPEFGEEMVAQGTQWDTRGDGWVTKDEVRIADYYFVEQRQVTRVKTFDGRILDDDEYDAAVDGPLASDRQGPIRKQVMVKDVWWLRINGYQILFKDYWGREWIPVVPVIGDELDVDGDVHYSGVTRYAKDAQKAYNTNRTSAVEISNMVPKAPYIGAEGQFEGRHKRRWETANIQNYPYLEYKPTSHDGHLNPPPQRQALEPPIQALVQQAMLDAEDMKATMNVYDAMVGAVTNETSGVAIQNRTNQTEVSNVHFPTNLARAVKHVACIVLAKIPLVYNTERVIKVVGEDDADEVIQLVAQGNQAVTKDGNTKLYDLTVGKYDVNAIAGPSSSTQREEALKSMVEMVSAYPQLMNVIGDMLVKNLPTPQAQEMADRIRRTIPPEILGSDEDVPEEVLQAQLTQAMQALQQFNALTQEQEQQIEMLQGQMVQLQRDLDDKTRDLDRKDAELALKAKQAQAKMVDDRRQTDIKQDAQELDEDEFAARLAQESQNGTAGQAE